MLPLPYAFSSEGDYYISDHLFLCLIPIYHPNSYYSNLHVYVIRIFKNQPRKRIYVTYLPLREYGAEFPTCLQHQPHSPSGVSCAPSRPHRCPLGRRCAGSAAAPSLTAGPSRPPRGASLARGCAGAVRAVCRGGRAGCGRRERMAGGGKRRPRGAAGPAGEQVGRGAAGTRPGAAGQPPPRAAGLPRRGLSVGPLSPCPSFCFAALGRVTGPRALPRGSRSSTERLAGSAALGPAASASSRRDRAGNGDRRRDPPHLAATLLPR